MKQTILFLLIIISKIGICNNNLPDSLNIDTTSHKTVKFIKPLIVPTVLITQGLICMKNQQKDQLNQFIKSSVTPVSKTKFPIDDYTQYLPTAAFLSLDYMGIKSKHNLKQKLYAGSLSHIIMAATVNIMKAKIHIMRPDQSSDNSFPSGHTATAFVGAELLWQEYHHLSPWYGIAGYTIASATGFFRMYNNKHWFSDVTMGAGIGILSTKLGYWLMPKFERMFSKKDKAYTILPTYQNNTFGLTYRQIL